MRLCTRSRVTSAIRQYRCPGLVSFFQRLAGGGRKLYLSAGVFTFSNGRGYGCILVQCTPGKSDLRSDRQGPVPLRGTRSHAAAIARHASKRATWPKLSNVIGAPPPPCHGISAVPCCISEILCFRADSFLSRTIHAIKFLLQLSQCMAFHFVLRCNELRDKAWC